MPAFSDSSSTEQKRANTKMNRISYGIAGAFAAMGITGASLALVIHAGGLSVRADQPHHPLVENLFEWARERSTLRESAAVMIPENLADPERIRRGAGNYAAMCATCHLSPSEKSSELASSLYPRPPNLTQTAEAMETDDHRRMAARQFWIIKHGIAASGMPAWSITGMEDEAIWDLVAFLHILPTLSSEKYRQIVEASDGHSHAGADLRHPPTRTTEASKVTAPKQAHNHDKHPH